MLPLLIIPGVHAVPQALPVLGICTAILFFLVVQQFRGLLFLSVPCNNLGYLPIKKGSRFALLCVRVLLVH